MDETNRNILYISHGSWPMPSPCCLCTYTRYELTILDKKSSAYLW